MDLKGEHIPKATMAAYLKEKLGKTKISTEFVEGILHLSNEYIAKISGRANQICTGENKKTISLDHLYQAIEYFKLKDQMEELKKVETEVKDQVAHKHEVKLKIQKSYEEMIKEGNGLEMKKESSLIGALKGGLTADLFKKGEAESEDYEQSQEEDKPTLKEGSPAQGEEFPE